MIEEITFIEGVFLLASYLIPGLIALAVLVPFADHVVQPWLDRRAEKKFGWRKKHNAHR